MNTQLQTLKGFRDFLPEEKRLRDKVAGVFRATFERYGFEPLETPTLEYASLLLGKYGDEADKLVYTFTDNGDRQVGLRYDQTVPTARVLAQYRNELPAYFRRYQIQNVFRADKPQKGRFREFTQCDIDIFGSTSALADAEILACTYDAFKALGFSNPVIKINDRKTLLASLSPFASEKVTVFSIVQSIDKLDKQTPEEIKAELVSKGLIQERAEEALASLRTTTPSENLSEIMKTAQSLGIPATSLQFTPELARGLDYYTGMIFEVTMPEFGLGSFGGGGRYDNLIEQLGGPATPAIGIGIGFDRVVEAVRTLEPAGEKNATVLVTIFSKETQEASASLAKQLRNKGVSVELYPAFDRLDKQFKYADKKKMQYVVVVGPDEILQKKIQIKNMQTGEQKQVEVQEVAGFVQKT